MGVLTGTGGVADMVEELIARMDKNTGAHVLYDDDPDSLIRRLVDYYHTSHYRRPSSLHDLGGPQSPRGAP